MTTSHKINISMTSTHTMYHFINLDYALSFIYNNVSCDVSNQWNSSRQSTVRTRSAVFKINLQCIKNNWIRGKDTMQTKE